MDRNKEMKTKDKEKDIQRSEGLEEEIDLRELIEVILRRKWAIAFLVALAVFFAGIFSLFVQREEYVTTVIEMDFPEIEAGEYPGGSSFDVGDITSPYITSRVVSELGIGEYGISAQDLREMIEVRELYHPADDEDEDPEPSYQYRLTIHEQDVSEFEELTYSMKRRILSSVVDTYRQEYSNEFMERPMFPRLVEDAGNILEQDYPFMNRNLRSYQEMFSDHLDNMILEIADEEFDLEEFDLEEIEGEFEGFYSSKYGMSFQDIGRRLERLKETRYENISAAIRTNSLTEDPEGAIRHYENLIEELRLSEEKKQSEAEYARELLDDAEPLRTGSMPETFPGMIEEGDHNLVGEIFDKLYRDNFYPQLLQVSLEAAEDSIDMAHEIRYMEDEIERMEELTNNNTEDLDDLKQRVEEDTIQLVGELNRLVNINNDMMEEYYNKRAEDGITFAVMPYHDVARGNLELNVALAGVLGLMIGVFGAFFHEFWKKSDLDKKDK